MSKNGKRKKSLLNRYKILSDSEILTELKHYIPKYILLVESEKKAQEILSKYGIKAYEKLNEEIKKKTLELIEVSKLRNILIPKEYYQVEVSNNDIIARIEQFKYEEIHWIDEHNYLFDLYDPNYPSAKIVDMLPEEGIWPSDKEIEKTIRMYDEIIKKEFGKNDFDMYEELQKRWTQVRKLTPSISKR